MDENRKMKKIVGYVRVDYKAVLGELAAIVKRAPADDAVEIRFEIYESPNGSIVLDCDMSGERESYDAEAGATHIMSDRRLSRDVWRRIMAQFTGAYTGVHTTDNETFSIDVAMHSLEQVYGYLRDCTLKLRMEVEYDEHIPA